MPGTSGDVGRVRGSEFGDVVLYSNVIVQHTHSRMGFPSVNKSSNASVETSSFKLLIITVDQIFSTLCKGEFKELTFLPNDVYVATKQYRELKVVARLGSSGSTRSTLGQTR